MIFFITVLRALAACLITNAHYTGIYPTDLIANGGLIGDIIFFAVSGYCLFNIKLSFLKWYLKRLFRVFVPVWIITIIYLILGCYDFTDKSLIEYFIYPTEYHFVASIILLYIPFYYFIKIEWIQKHLPIVMCGIGLIAIGVYFLFYDTSYYHIDAVREPFIRFLFFESMLLGAYFKKYDKQFRNRKITIWLLLTIFSFMSYFVSKLLFSKVDALSNLQIINQVIIFILLYCVFRLFSGMDACLNKLPEFVRRIIICVADMTLEIYVVQYVIIDVLRPLFKFPVNWIVITVSIGCSAFVLHWITKGIHCFIDQIIVKRSCLVNKHRRDFNNHNC